MPAKMDRRMLLGAGVALASAGTIVGAQAAPRRVGPNDRVRIGVIGVRGMGWSNAQAHLKLPDVQIAALCDVDANVLAERAGELKKMTGRAPSTHKDYRRLLDDKSIDAVIIGTPDHWHCLQTIDACSAGKDVYVEKPLGNSIAECRAMVAAKQRYGRVVQVGQWQRSNSHWREAIALVHGGKIGRVRLVKCWAYMNWFAILPKRPDGAPPAGVDYNSWLGPAPLRPFNENRFHFNFRWYWDYAGGLMTDWGVHLVDMALLGMKAGDPKAIVSLGGPYAYPTSAMETPDTQSAIFDFGDFSISWEHCVGIGDGPYGQRDHGVAFIGDLGTLVVDRGGWELLPENKDGKDLTEALPRQGAKDDGLALHAANFVACIKDRSMTPNAPIEAAAHTANVCHMGNIAYRTGKKLNWNGSAFADAEADALITPAYRAPWTLPNASL